MDYYGNNGACVIKKTRGHQLSFLFCVSFLLFYLHFNTEILCCGIYLLISKLFLYFIPIKQTFFFMFTFFLFLTLSVQPKELLKQHPSINRSKGYSDTYLYLTDILRKDN